jgi:hypothetical protein
MLSVTHIFNDFVTLFVVVDPIVVLPTFLALTGDCPPAIKRKLAVQSVVVAFIVMLFFIALAQIVVIAGATAAVMIALLLVKPFYSATTDPRAASSADVYQAARLWSGSIEASRHRADGQAVASVLRDGQENANIRANLGFGRRILC